MNFFRVTVTFSNAVNIIHDAIITPNPYPCTAIFVFVGVRNNMDRQMYRSTNQTLKQYKPRFRSHPFCMI